MAVGAQEHAVVLVPGFLGFGRGGAPGQAAERVGAVLRSALEARWGRSVPVVAVPAEPALDLATRQGLLLERLRVLDGVLYGVRHFHLVGHGAGGVDAELLTNALPLKPGCTWNDLDHGDIRERIASVLTLASPHYGTNLVEQAAFGVLREPLATDTHGWRQAGRLARGILPALHRGRLSCSSLARTLSARAGALPFVLRLLRSYRIFGDLSPVNMQTLRLLHAPDPELDIAVESLVVVAPEVEPVVDGRTRARDALFAAVHGLTALSSLVAPCDELTRALELLNAFPKERVIRHPSATVPAFDLSVSDGVVNAARQVLLTRSDDSSAIAGMVIADHADVLGHYDRRDPLAGRAGARRGLFRSGAWFGDDQFFQLWGLIASRIAGMFSARQRMVSGVVAA